MPHELQIKGPRRCSNAPGAARRVTTEPAPGLLQLRRRSSRRRGCSARIGLVDVVEVALRARDALAPLALAVAAAGGEVAGGDQPFAGEEVVARLHRVGHLLRSVIV